jgi:4'-phosphopantetheinyl transferase EntD
MSATSDPGLLNGLLSDGVVTAETDPDHEADALLPEEAVLVQNAVAKRRREFNAGRACARRALGRLGIELHPLTAGKDRVPHWPDGIVGSISHTHGWCGAAVARAAQFESVGVDAERDDDLKLQLWPMICTERETQWLAALPEEQRGWVAKAIFSAKESLYKCQYLLTHTFLGFHAVETEFDLERGLVRSFFRQDVGSV